jgi:single-stranded DNA-binding protein
LIAGPVTGRTPAHHPWPDLAYCTFLVETKRTMKRPDLDSRWTPPESLVWVEELATVTVQTFGHLADVCAEYLTAGRGVRIVGRIVQDLVSEGHPLYLVADHVEFKPERSTT